METFHLSSVRASNLRVPSNLVAMVSRKVFCGASSPFRPGILARKNSSSGLNQASFPDLFSYPHFSSSEMRGHRTMVAWLQRIIAVSIIDEGYE